MQVTRELGKGFHGLDFGLTVKRCTMKGTGRMLLRFIYFLNLLTQGTGQGFMRVEILDPDPNPLQPLTITRGFPPTHAIHYATAPHAVLQFPPLMLPVPLASELDQIALTLVDAFLNPGQCVDSTCKASYLI